MPFSNHDEHERIKLLLDTVPLACRLMRRSSSGRFELFECNEESVKLFNFKDKQEFIERYFEIYPEFQPNGLNSVEEGQKHFDRAYNEGSCVINFCFRTVDGTPIPAEVKLIRVKYEDEDVVAGYTRDLRDQTRMQHDIERRDELLGVINRVAAMLLSPAEERDFEELLLEGMEYIGSHLEADCVQIWKNETIDGTLHYTLQHEWLSEEGHKAPPVQLRTTVPYSARLKELFLRGECVNGPVRELPPEDYEVWNSFGLTSTITIPLYHRSVFWGLFCVDDCVKERYYTDSEVDILRSAGLMLVNAMIRGAQVVEVREAHERTELLFDAMPMSSCMINRNKDVFSCNEGTVRLFKLSGRSEFIDHFYNFSPEYQPDGRSSHEASEDYIKKAFDDGICVFEWLHTRADGTPLPAETTLVRIAYDGDYALAAYIRDLSDQREMMAEIEHNSTMLRTVNQVAGILLQSESEGFENELLRCMSMIGTTVSADRVCIWKNKTIDERLYCDLVYVWPESESAMIDSEAAVDVSYDDNTPGWEEILSSGECINTTISLLSPEEQAQLAAHGVKSIFVAPVFVRGDFWGYVGFDDYHNEKLLSADEASTLYSGSLLIANALIRNEMVLSIQAANSAKSDFLAKMSHEMRTPLNAVVGLSALSLEDSTLNEETRQNIEKISSSGDLLLSTVNDILDISKIEAGKLDLTPVKYDLPSLLNDTVTQSIMYIQEKPIEFVLNIGEDLPAQLYGDDLRIKQIFNNLLSNAFKYTREGTVEFGIRCDSYSEIPDTVWMTAWVKDSGIGIKPEDIDNLFSEFVQTDAKSNRYVAGTGLGLSITKRMTELMGGSVSVESEYGIGSTFTVVLQQKYVADERIGPEVVDNLKSLRYVDQKNRQKAGLVRPELPYASVLVVDDNITNLDVAKGLMKPYKLKHIDCVTSGMQAVDMIRAEKVKYNAIFMDHMMPEMDGVEATALIREIGTDYARSVPVIACTANAITGSEQMYMGEGFQAFLSKPIEVSRLDEIIRRWVRDKDYEALQAEKKAAAPRNPEHEGGGSAKPLREKPDRGTLYKLIGACGNNDDAVVDEALRDLEAFEYETNDGIVAWLRKNVPARNYQLIIDRISALLEE